jgi:hypothetical protein
MPREMREEPEHPTAAAETDPSMVTAMFAGSLDEAERCCELLKENGIPALVGASEEDGCRARSVGIPLLVPEPLLESASEILSARTEDEDEAPPDLSNGREDEDDFDDDEDDEVEDEDEFEAEDEESWDDNDEDFDEDDDDV